MMRMMILIFTLSFFLLLNNVSANKICDCSDITLPYTSIDPIASIEIKLGVANIELDFVEIVSVRNNQCKLRIFENKLHLDSDTISFQIAQYLLFDNVDSCLLENEEIDVYVSSTICCPSNSLRRIATNIILNTLASGKLILNFGKSILDPKISSHAVDFVGCDIPQNFDPQVLNDAKTLTLQDFSDTSIFLGLKLIRESSSGRKTFMDFPTRSSNRKVNVIDFTMNSWSLPRQNQERVYICIISTETLGSELTSSLLPYRLEFLRDSQQYDYKINANAFSFGTFTCDMQLIDETGNASGDAIDCAPRATSQSTRLLSSVVECGEMATNLELKHFAVDIQLKLGSNRIHRLYIERGDYPDEPASCYLNIDGDQLTKSGEHIVINYATLLKQRPCFWSHGGKILILQGNNGICGASLALYRLAYLQLTKYSSQYAKLSLTSSGSVELTPALPIQVFPCAKKSNLAGRPKELRGATSVELINLSPHEILGWQVFGDEHCFKEFYDFEKAEATLTLERIRSAMPCLGPEAYIIPLTAPSSEQLSMKCTRFLPYKLHFFNGSGEKQHYKISLLSYEPNQNISAKCESRSSDGGAVANCTAELKERMCHHMKDDCSACIDSDSAFKYFPGILCAPKLLIFPSTTEVRLELPEPIDDANDYSVIYTIKDDVGKVLIQGAADQYLLDRLKVKLVIGGLDVNSKYQVSWSAEGLGTTTPVAAQTISTRDIYLTQQDSEARSVKLHILPSTYRPETKSRFIYNISDISNKQQPILLHGHKNANLSYNALSDTNQEFSNLRPGTNYNIDWKIQNLLTGRWYTGKSLLFKTLCKCQKERSNDAPIATTESIRQFRGQVYFKFVANSLCGIGYGFARYTSKDTAAGVGTVFTPDYMYYGDHSCASTYEPKNDATDDLKQSNLIVNTKYFYAIHAIGRDYKGSSLVLEHTVEWEAIVNGFVGLSSLSGKIPVEQVKVEWKLYNLQNKQVAYGSSLTDSGGRFTIRIAKALPFKNTESYPLVVKFAKKTPIDGGLVLNHEFLCDDERVNCTIEGKKLYLRHLDFDVPLEIVDASAVLVSGKVYIANTKVDSHDKGWGGDGCPVANVTVCLIDKGLGSVDASIVCVETLYDGTYALPATIGSRVAVNATLDGHSFQMIQAGAHDFDAKEGFVARAGQRYERIDFQDTTIAGLDVTIAGGLCDLFLGDATVHFTVVGCPWGGIESIQTQVQRRYQIPAHSMTVSVSNVDGRPNVEFPPQNIDLSHANDNAINEALMKVSSDTEVASMVRFQYNGKSKLRVEFSENLNSECDGLQPPTGQSFDDLIVMEFETPSYVIFYVEKDMGDGLVCDNVDPESMQLSVHNNLGLLYGDPDDDAFKAMIEKTYPPQVVALMTACNNGCLLNLTRDFIAETNSYANARFQFMFMTGRPNNQKPYTKYLSAETTEVNSVRYRAEVVLVGQRQVGVRNTVSLPTYEPLLIIRDPPGGGSSSFYKNVQSHIRAETGEVKEYHGMTDEFKFSAGTNLVWKACVGFGYSVCAINFEFTALGGYKQKNMQNELKIFKKFVRSGGLTTTWSYTTSSSSNFVGDLSDIFVVPNILMKYLETDIVSWDAATCQASKYSEITFSLVSPENVPALSFVSAYEINKIEIPSLRQLINQRTHDIDDCTDPKSCEELREQLTALQDALQGWEDTLRMNQETKAKAVSGNGLVRPDEWFDKIAKRTYTDKAVNGSGITHRSGFVSDTLAADAHVRDRYKGSATDLNALNMIRFAGGGATLAYQLNRKSLKQVLGMMGNPEENQKGSSSLAVGVDVAIKAIHFYTEDGYSTTDDNTYDRQHSRTDDDSAETAIGFTLADPNIGDVFNIEVYIDPHFGTFVFHTVSGKSMCPHEANTDMIAKPFLEILEWPPAVVLGTEKITFQLRMTNAGTQASPFVLNYENVNVTYGGLQFYRALPVTFDMLKPGQSVVLTLSITRGPKLYEYPPVVVKFQVGCDAGLEVDLDATDDGVTKDIKTLSNVGSGAGAKLVYARPCPNFEVAGSLRNDGTFKVTKETNTNGIVRVAIRNPETEYMTMYSATQDPSKRLLNIQLEYRRIGAPLWDIGQHNFGGKIVPIDFAAEGIENNFGIMLVNWEVGTMLSDGDYEIRIISKCPKISGAPPEFEQFSSDTIRGVVDRQAPQLFGAIKPRQKLPIGQDIVIEFTKDLHCNRPYVFKVEIAIDGYYSGTVFDNSNLLIVCEERKIAVQFDQERVSFDKLVDHKLSMTISNVVDSSGNTMDDPISYTVHVIETSEENPAPRRRLTSASIGENIASKRVPSLNLEYHSAEISDSINDRLQRTRLQFKSSATLKDIEEELNKLKAMQEESTWFIIIGVVSSLFLVLFVEISRFRRE